MDQQRLQFAGEHHSGVGLGVIEGLNPHPVANQQQRLRPPVPNGKGKYPVEQRQHRLAPGQVQMQQHLGVRMAPEGVPPRLQLAAQLTKVVDLAVEDDGHLPRGIEHRLMPRRRQVDDRQTAVGQTDPLFGPMEIPRVVGAAMNDLLPHKSQGGLGKTARKTGYAAHGVVPLASGWRIKTVVGISGAPARRESAATAYAGPRP